VKKNGSQYLWSSDTTVYCRFPASDAPRTRTHAGSAYDTASDAGCWAGRGPVIGHAKMTRPRKRRSGGDTAVGRWNEKIEIENEMKNKREKRRRTRKMCGWRWSKEKINLVTIKRSIYFRCSEILGREEDEILW